MPMNPPVDNLNDETPHAWEANAQFRDARMGDEGNDFANVLCWPAVRTLLDPQPGHPRPPAKESPSARSRLSWRRA